MPFARAVSEDNPEGLMAEHRIRPHTQDTIAIRSTEAEDDCQFPVKQTPGS
jgi:hypothetical protein